MEARRRRKNDWKKNHYHCVVVCLPIFLSSVQWHSKRSSLRPSFIIWREITRFGLVSFGPLPSELLSDGSVCDLSGALVASLCVCLPSLLLRLIVGQHHSGPQLSPTLRPTTTSRTEQNNQSTTKRREKKTACQENRLDTHCLKEKE